MSDTELKVCPFCRCKVNASVMQIGHKKGCFLKAVLDKEPFKTGEQWDEAWNTRTNAKEELVEIIKNDLRHESCKYGEDYLQALEDVEKAIKELDI